MSHHVAVHLHPLTNVPTKFQLLLRFLRYSPEKIFKLKVFTARSKDKSRSHHDVVRLYPQPMFLPNNNFLHLSVSEIRPRQTPTHTHYCPPARSPLTYPERMGENNTSTALKGFMVKLKAGSLSKEGNNKFYKWMHLL